MINSVSVHLFFFVSSHLKGCRIITALFHVPCIWLHMHLRAEIIVFPQRPLQVRYRSLYIIRGLLYRDARDDLCTIPRATCSQTYQIARVLVLTLCAKLVITYVCDSRFNGIFCCVIG